MSVLVGFTPTPEGRAAVERAVGECRLRRSALSILLSQPRPASPAARPVGPPVTAADLNTLLEELDASEVECRVHEADPLLDLADQLLELAEDEAVELIVIGLRRRTPAGKLILGSSAQRVLLEASCPVLAVKVDHRIALRDGRRQPEQQSDRQSDRQLTVGNGA